MNVEIETEAAQIPEKEDINGVFVAVWSMHVTWNRYRFHFLRLSWLEIFQWKAHLWTEGKEGKTVTHSWDDRVGERPFL